MDFDWVSATAIVIGNIFCYLLGRYTISKELGNVGVIHNKETQEVVAVTICDDRGRIKHVIWEKENDTRG